MVKTDLSGIPVSHISLARELSLKISDPHRFEHTLSVARECAVLSEIFSLSSEDSDELYTAALLHDVAKGKQTHEYIELDKKYGVGFTKGDLESPAVLHAKAGAKIAETEFSNVCDDAVVTAIRQHTTGDADMSLISKLLFLADYIEPTRRWESCKKTRERFYAKIKSGKSVTRVLDETILEILVSTEAHLKENGKKVHPNLTRCKDFILKTIE